MNLCKFKLKKNKASLLLSYFTSLIFFSSPLCSAEPEHFEYAIPAQPLVSALVEFFTLSEEEYIAPIYILENKRSNAIEGVMSPQQALSLLLANTGLEFKRNKDGVFLIMKKKKTKVATADKADLYLEETLVTALKRRQFNQDVPLSISTISGASLNETGKTNTRDLFIVAPSISFHGAISSSGQGMRLRGVGTGVIASGIEQSVGTIIDGVVTGPSGSGLQELWDVERVEILKGPQGTLFGKNVSAGAINQITRDPSDNFEAKMSGRWETEYQSQRLDGFLSGPLNQNFTYRVAAFHLNQDQGTVDNVVRNQEENDKNRWGIRTKLFYESNNVWAKFSTAYDTLDERCCARVFSHIDEDTANAITNNTAIPALSRYAVQANNNNRISITEGELKEKASTWHTVFELGKEFQSGHVIKSISGHRRWKHESVNDADNIDIDIFSSVSDQNDIEIVTQEFQWLSPLGQDWEYLLGAYYFEQRFPKTERIGGGIDFSGAEGLTTIDSNIDTKHYALFGHTTYHVNDVISVFSGLRLIRERITARGQQQGDHWLWSTDYPVNRISTADNDFVGTLGLQFRPAEDNQVYFSVTRGYKGKAIDNPSNSIFFRAPQTLENGQVVTAEEAILEPETVLNFELGTKNYLLDHSLLLNLTTYYATFRDFQASGFDGVTSSFRLANAGVVKSQGVEMDIQGRPWRGALMSLSAAWVDTYFDEYTGAPCQLVQTIAGTCGTDTGGQDLSGESVNESPKFQYFASYRQDFDVGHGTLYFDFRYGWRDDVVFGGDLDPNTQQEAFGLLDLKAGLESDRYALALFVNNATDENYSHRIIDAPLWRGAYQRYPGQERTMGIELSYRFD